MTILVSAFQIGAFQFTGFQEAGGAGSGGWRPFWTSLQLAHRRREIERRRKEREKKKEEEVVEPELETVAMRVTPISVPRYQIMLAKQIRATNARALEREEAEFAEFMKMIADIEETV
jgi:hypothetical protein